MSVSYHQVLPLALHYHDECQDRDSYFDLSAVHLFKICMFIVVIYYSLIVLSLKICMW